MASRRLSSRGLRASRPSDAETEREPLRTVSRVERCYFVYALAPPGMSAREANTALNDYVADQRRGVPVVHDHFIGKPHGGFVIVYPRGEERDRLDEHGPLEGWQLVVRPLTFALTPVGFAAQVDFTLDNYGGTSLEALRAEEPPDRRFWWQRRTTRT
jgi:hypothetical protein